MNHMHGYGQILIFVRKKIYYCTFDGLISNNNDVPLTHIIFLFEYFNTCSLKWNLHVTCFVSICSRLRIFWSIFGPYGPLQTMGSHHMHMLTGSTRVTFWCWNPSMHKPILEPKLRQYLSQDNNSYESNEKHKSKKMRTTTIPHT